MSSRVPIVVLWLVGLALALGVVLHARYVTDLSGFLPRHPSAAQRLLIEQLREGAASRTLMIALEGGTPAQRAAISRAMTAALARDPAFAAAANGDRSRTQADRRFFFEHRYQLSPAVDARHFTVKGLHESLAESIDALALPSGEWLKDLIPHDPTGELLALIDELGGTRSPRESEGVWVSADGTRALLLAQMAAPGSDLDAASTALTRIRTTFERARHAQSADAVELLLSGPPVFAVASRAQIERAAVRLSTAGAVLVLGVLLSVYRSFGALLLGLMPVASGALAGLAAVALAFGEVQGTTLGFGSTLIGESLDYSIYFFVGASALGAARWRTHLWPTVRLGMLVSVCGFASLLPVGFPGLAQLAVYSVGGLLAAAAVTRFVLPALRPAGLTLRDLTPLGRRIGQLIGAARRPSRRLLLSGAALAGVLALGVLIAARHRLWSNELSSLSPIPADAQRLDAELRADLKTSDVTQLVVVRGADLEQVMQGAERAAGALAPSIRAHLLGGIDDPADYVPSRKTQRERIASLPDTPVLRERLRAAAAGLPLEIGQLEPFVADVEAARHAPPLTPESLAGTSLEAAFRALVLHAPDHWTALLPLHAPDPLHPAIDAARVRAALAQLRAEPNGAEIRLLDLKGESDALYQDYLRAALRGALAGFLAITLLVALARRSLASALQVLMPLVLAVLIVAAALALAGEALTLMHLVGLLLIVAVGSNYALFFAGAEQGPAPLTLAALVIANLSTVLGFGLLVLSRVPVLTALGVTVAPGTLLALLLSALLLGRRAAPPLRAQHA
jgi:predicted exporter